MIGRLQGAALTTLIVLALAFPYTWFVQDQRDQAWVQKLKDANGRILKVIHENNVAIDTLDKRALEELDEQRKQIEAELDEYKSRQSIPLSEACNRCRVPASRLWLR